jgi:hypothetical protein
VLSNTRKKILDSQERISKVGNISWLIGFSLIIFSFIYFEDGTTQLFIRNELNILRDFLILIMAISIYLHSYSYSSKVSKEEYPSPTIKGMYISTIASAISSSIIMTIGLYLKLIPEDFLTAPLLMISAILYGWESYKIDNPPNPKSYMEEQF